MAFDLEKSLNETVVEFKKRIEKNSNLGNELPKKISYHTTLKGKNPFLIHADLIR